MAFWLVKTEPDLYSIDDLKRDSATLWSGVRNFQARNYLLAMQLEDRVLVYHSNAKPPGVVGVARVIRLAEADLTQFDSKSEYFDPRSKREHPRWFAPLLEFVSKFPAMVPLDTLRREESKLAGLPLLQRGSRLSVIPVSEGHFNFICALGR
jgi:predicted RNA-binding protein with PUA-like domain